MDVVGTRRHQRGQLDAELGNALQQPLGAGLGVASIRRRVLSQGFPDLQKVTLEGLELQGGRLRVAPGLGGEALGMEYLRAVVAFGSENLEEFAVRPPEPADGRRGSGFRDGPLEEARQIGREPVRRRPREGARKTVRRGILEPVSLIHDQVVVFGQHLAEIGLAHDQVRHQQVMVHDQDLAGMRPLPQGRQVTLLVVGTAAADAVVGNGRDAAPIVGRSPESTNFVAVSGLRLLRPGGDPPEVGGAPGIELQVPRGLELLPLQATEIVLPALHAGHRHAASQNALKLGKVLVEELVLKIPRRRRDHDPLTAEQRRDEIGERLPDSGPRLDHQRPVPTQRLFDPRRHLHLSGPVFEAGQRLGQHPVRTEEISRPTHFRQAAAQFKAPGSIPGHAVPPNDGVALERRQLL